MKKLVIKNLNQQYNYGDFGVQNISLECDASEAISILGGSEAGKTSLLKCIAGLYPAKSGEIIINDIDITHKKPKFRDIMLTHSDGGFFKLRTVFYNLAYPLKIRKLSKQEIKQKIEEIAEKLKFSHLLDFKITTLSGTEKVRIMIARTLLRKASVYLFDDPFKLAEPLERRNVFIELLPIIKSLEGAKVFATSSVDEAKSLSDNIIIMNYGYVVDEGSREKLEKEPQCLLSYKFMNGYAANSVITKVFEENDELIINILGKKIYLSPEKLINPVYVNNDIIACFVTVDGKREGIENNIDFVEHYNNSLIIHSKINDEKIKTQIFEMKKIPSHIDIELSNLKLFDINSEKLVYFN